MKKTKQSEKKINGNKLSFRINQIEDAKIIEYMEKSTNGSAFIKDAIKFYIHNIEAGRIKCYWIQSEEERFADIINSMNNSIVAEPTIHINEFDTKENDREDLIMNYDMFDETYDDLDEYKSANN